MQIYIVILEDRHCDVFAKPFVNKEKAISEARKMAEDGARDEPVDEQDIDGWEYYAVFSCEGDCVRVVEEELNEEVL